MVRLFLLLSTFALHASDLPVVRAYYPEGLGRPQLDGIGEILVHDRQRHFLILEVGPRERRMLSDLGWQVVEDTSLTQRVRDRELQAGDGRAIPGFPCYPTVAETFQLAQTMAMEHPDLAEWIDIGDSWEKQNGVGGEDLMVLRLTNETVAGPKPAIFIMSGLHAREYSPGGITTRFASYLVDNYGLDADVTWLLDAHEIHLLFYANPDGRVRAESGQSWRKNADNDFCTDSVVRGVDLNRNFEFQWGFTSTCSGTAECGNTFRGPSPGSEPEIMAIRDYLRTIFPDQRGEDLSDPAPDDATGVFLDLHSFSRLVLWPYGFDNTPAPNNDGLASMGRKLAWFNDYNPEKASQSFDSCGASDDFAYGDLGVAAFTFEIGNSFFEPCANFEASIWPDNLAALLYAAKAAHAPYQLPSGPNSEEPQLSSNALAAGDALRVEAWISDARFNQDNGTEPVQDIAGATLFLNELPWEVGAVGTAMSALDGAFDSDTERVRGQLNTDALSPGRHWVTLWGEDNEGRQGAPIAAFFDVYESAQSLSITGTVHDLDLAVPAAVIRVGDREARPDSQSGSFKLLLPPGEHTLHVEATGFLPLDLAVGGAAGDQQDLDILLLPECSESLQSTTETWDSNGWTLIPAARGGYQWSDSPDGDYRSNLDATLTSPDFYREQANSYQLSFSRQHQLDPYGDDYLVLEISRNGGPWSELMRYRGRGRANTREQLNIAASGPIRFRFRLHTDEAFTHEGVELGDFQLVALGDTCAQGQLYDAWPNNVTILNILPYL